MTAEIRIQWIVQHQWLKHPKQTRFHAYGDCVPGTLAFCGDANAIPANLNIMEIPGTNSGTCYSCFCKLYGIKKEVK